MNTKLLSSIIVIFVVLLLFIPGKTFAATQTQSVTLTPSNGEEIGFVYEAFLNPNQEPADEEDTPPFAPKEFLSTAPSVPRNQRKSRGHGMLRITNDLSKAYVYVNTENVNLEDINMFHIHCGRPDQLGPILIDFGNSSNIQKNSADGTFEVELRNEDIEKVSNSGHGIVGAFTAGCPIVPGIPGDVKTIAGMQYIAQKGELYFTAVFI
ncbi:CHRD domain-containing protein [Dapis sp. BLCC M229]|uniref:CHRD domain-containing protein n=1 Tax=Dapis sp. BLCC M229 TaxID=3400188 RepID=UPI003CF463EF